MIVTVITPSNVAIFSKYIIPNIKHGSRPRSLCTVYLHTVYCTACRHSSVVPWDRSGTEGTWGDQSTSQSSGIQQCSLWGALWALLVFVNNLSYLLQISYDASMQELQNQVQDHLSTLLMDPSSIVKHAVLHDISSLCIFLARQKTNDVLLSHMILERLR